MYLKRDRVLRSFCGFTKVPESHEGRRYPHHIDKEELVALIKYMDQHGFKLGMDFYFMMGWDCPDDKRFNAALQTRSKMTWKEKVTEEELAACKNMEQLNVDEKGYIYREQLIAVCIEVMKEDLARTDHLEVVEDIV